MRLALPVSVKFLHKGNKDLSRNMSSYLSLAAIENAELLAQHIQPVIDSVISGNYSLARVLPQIYSVNRDPIKSHVMTLVSILPNCDNPEKMALLNLFALVAKDNPSLLEPSIPQLCDGLTSQSTATSTLQVFSNMAMTRPQPLADQTSIIKRTAESLVMIFAVKHDGYRWVKAKTSFKTIECFSSSSRPIIDNTKSSASCPFS